jgi:hypothetical protein
MKTECTAGQLEFHGLGRRAVVGEFDGGKISSDSGGVLLREVEQRTHILKRLAGCFVDHRDADQIEHTLEAVIKQRVMGLALGYEDLNDHDALRQDPLLALLSDVAEPTGADRRRARLRKADQDGAGGTVDELAPIIERMRLRWPRTRIIVRGDSGFCRDDLMSWCEARGVDYVLGLAKNSRLKAAITTELAEAKVQYEASLQAARVFKDFPYQTRWPARRQGRGVGRVAGRGHPLGRNRGRCAGGGRAVFLRAGTSPQRKHNRRDRCALFLAA